MKTDKISIERLEQLKALFPKYREILLEQFFEVDMILKTKYPELSTDERLEKTIAVCSMILGTE